MQLNHQLVPRWIFTVLIILAVIGFADATFLTIEHYSNSIPPCTTDGCETVLTSSYSSIAGIPVALFGAMYYLTMLILLMIYLDAKIEKVLRIALFFSIFGFIFSLYFLYLQAFVINAYCQYCLLSAFTSTAIFVIAMYVVKKFKVQSLPQSSL